MKSDGEELRRSIRLRPSMYIGSTDAWGLQSLVEPWLLLGFMGRRFPAHFLLQRMRDLSVMETGGGWCLRDEVTRGRRMSAPE
ncbi:hypothetical protein ACN47A_10020 [Myxococcus fulvus]|uniref:hypothetical protein n=1 Tax=Myxococcus fulvus TaxID=33 RepID=UPI003B99152E